MSLSDHTPDPYARSSAGQGGSCHEEAGLSHLAVRGKGASISVLLHKLPIT